METSSRSTIRIFISYKRGVTPDEPVALEVFRAFSQDYSVFIDQTMTVGTQWAAQIEAELRQADYFIPLLSGYSVSSEMVKGEIETAYHLGKQHGKPKLLPVRVAYQEPFQYPLSAYLNEINWAFWQDPQDTERLLAELRRAIAGNSLSIETAQAKADLIQASVPSPIPQPQPFAQPIPTLEMPEGTMAPESAFYVEREADEIALKTIQRQGVTITIKGPRQMGKSSLLLRTIGAAGAMNKRVAFLDFQLFDKTALTDANQFFRQFCVWLTDVLEMDDRVQELWNDALGHCQNCTRYVQRYLLKELGVPMVLAMDEVECIFDTEFRSDFFSMLRSWHNSRATMPVWKQLDLALVTSTEPYQLIDNLNQSPFNVGQVLELTDFNAEQVMVLNQRHGSPLSLTQVGQLMELLGGHPYLTRRALYLVATQQITIDHLFEQAAHERGPFGDHLRYHLFRMHDKQELVHGLLQVLNKQTCQDERLFFRLRGAGLVRRDGQRVVPRCQLYAAFFQEHLHG
ncbi:AAA-like domain-containing protein [Alkalinema sp. FACHB-956]|uniref:AAA-like domain-containing protein n=1 Tax=Alkalinema sp. FACHB-956 TaxID=2692768 RepID=UPI001683D966|nr:AAA-like domain-containing protein [Alkalinema sp. FACHB-956]MBD2329656.1 AAA-like domain-containing protein [Alkalinema sp. FACHB-956]